MHGRHVRRLPRRGRSIQSLDPVAIFVALLALASSASVACPLDPKQLALDGARDARAVITRLWDAGPCEEHALTQFGTGAADWIALAVILKPHADAFASESLTSSMGEAMRHAPSRVLPLVDDPHFNTGVCFPDSFDDSDEGVRVTRRRFAQAGPLYRRFLHTSLASQARKCLAALASRPGYPADG